MRPVLSSVRRPGVAVATLVLAAALATITGPQASAQRTARAAAHTTTVKVHRGGPDATIGFHRGRTGEAFLNVTGSARGVSWATRKNTSAVVSAYVDGHYATDIVIMSSRPVTRQFGLGSLRAGHHTLRLHYATHRSRSKAGVAKLADIAVTTVSPDSTAYAAARYAPVLHGRNVEPGGKFQNNRTDAPLVAWHQVLPAATPGHSLIEYSVMWSNEDGGTDSSLLMAQWGRTTDIEWIYRVEVNARGRRVPGTGVFQAPAHATKKFRGRYDGTHPLLQTCTSNNNVCDKPTLEALHQKRDPMRFSLSTRDVLPADQPREHEMDTHPWTYQVMAAEMRREHKIEKPSNPLSPAVGDQRSYLYLALDHVADPASSAGAVGLAVDVRLKGDPTTYSSIHGNSLGLGSINRNGPAATTVELPVGTTLADIASISVHRVPVLNSTDTATLTVSRLDRAFFLRSNYLPGSSLAPISSSIVLTAGAPTADIWTAP